MISSLSARPLPSVSEAFFAGRPKVQTFLGLPDLRPDYCQAARLLDAPIMLSANALARPWTQAMREDDLPHPGFNPPPRDGRLNGLRIALDSMGFTAMERWGGYPVTVEQYFELAKSYPWEFWSSQDLCCEPKVAGDDMEIAARLMESAYRYDRLAEMADEAGIKRPLKIVQGWEWWHYVISAETLDITEKDTLIGIGSVCKRHKEGPSGVVTIIDQLDRILPPNVRFHLFGVTSDALEVLASHPRVASTDSQAWGRGLRWDFPIGRNNLLSARYAADFYRSQVKHIETGLLRPYAGNSEALPVRPAHWAGQTEEWKIKLAEVLHEIRNGGLDAYSWRLSLDRFEAMVEAGVDPRLRTWVAYEAALAAGWDPDALRGHSPPKMTSEPFTPPAPSVPRLGAAASSWLFDDVPPDSFGLAPKRGKPPNPKLAAAIAPDAPIPDPTPTGDDAPQLRFTL